MMSHHDPERPKLAEEKLNAARAEFKSLSSRDPALARAIFRCRLLGLGAYGTVLSQRDIALEMNDNVVPIR